MDRRRVLVLVAAVAAGAVLVVLGRPGGGDAPGSDAARTPQPTPTVPVPSQPAVPAIVDGGVAGAERLDPAQVPEALAAAERFAALWASPAPDWYARLAPLATPALAGALAGADPPEPARELTGAAQLYLDTPQWARIGVPAVRGTVVLDLVATGGGWLVSAVDWWPA